MGSTGKGRGRTQGSSQQHTATLGELLPYPEMGVWGGGGFFFGGGGGGRGGRGRGVERWAVRGREGGVHKGAPSNTQQHWGNFYRTRGGGGGGGGGGGIEPGTQYTEKVSCMCMEDDEMMMMMMVR